MRESANQVGGDCQGASQGHDPRVAEPQGWGPPPVHQGRSRDPLKGWTRKDTTLTDMFMIHQSAVNVTGFGLQFGKMDQPAQHTQIGGVVDHRLDPQRPAFLEILLGAGMFIADVDTHINAAGDHPGSKDAGVDGRIFLPKISSICSGRPRSRLSATKASKNAHPLRGWSNTIVRDTSIWRIDSSHQYPAADQ